VLGLALGADLAAKLAERLRRRVDYDVPRMCVDRVHDEQRRTVNPARPADVPDRGREATESRFPQKTVAPPKRASPHIVLNDVTLRAASKAQTEEP
jgi:hypothetical protein